MDCCTRHHECFVCKDTVSLQYANVQCVRCAIYMHHNCYETAKNKDVGYSQCLSCNRVGTLGIDVGFLTSVESEVQQTVHKIIQQ